MLLENAPVAAVVAACQARGSHVRLVHRRYLTCCLLPAMLRLVGQQSANLRRENDGEAKVPGQGVDT